MKGPTLRTLCAILLLMIAMGIMAGVILAMPEEEITAWTKISFQTRGKQTLSLYDSTGTLIEALETDKEGLCSTDLLEEGHYYGVCRDGLVEFSLTAAGIEEATGGAVATDKHSLTFSASGQKGELRIYGQARQEWYKYELRSLTYSCNRVLRCKPGEDIQCIIENLPCGEYILLENDRTLCRVEITEENPVVEVSLP